MRNCAYLFNHQIGKEDDQKNLPTKDPSPGACARLSGAHGNRRWSQSAQEPPGKRSPSPDGDHEQPRQENQLEELSAALTRWAAVQPCPVAGPATVNRRFRLTRSADVKRVRTNGRSYSHPLLVLVAAPNDLQASRFAVAAGRSVGSAVQRNRAKRRLREAVRQQIHQIRPGWDVLLIARRPITQAEFSQLQAALQALLARANLSIHQHVQ